ncbi:hypothetical protein ACE38W_16495 [Chitinophaga sp. Hz27]|uniref:hypothetical protein n=1 Tax=Chitinophaga sp. Hz27 TaxID=3347169 RepID=UPI0035E0F0B1
MLDKVVLPSPEATAINRFGNWPIGNFTGTPEVSIPLFEIKSGNLKLPVTLAYHSKGVKVTDVASNVGMSWSLIAGGSVNRTRMGGVADELPDRGFWDSWPVTTYYYYILEKMAHGGYDSQPDIFSYSIPSGNGKFLFDSNKVMHAIPYEKIKIDYNVTYAGMNNPFFMGGAIYPIVKFTITKMDGTVYEFEDLELAYSEALQYIDRAADPQIPDAAGLNPSDAYPNTWHLTRIISHDKKDTISFEYEDRDVSYKVHSKSEVFVTGKANPYLSGYISTVHIRQHIRNKCLKKILFSSGRVEFYERTARKDELGANRLDSVVLYNSNNERLNAYNFYYSYLNGTQMMPDNAIPAGTPAEELRLFLDSVQQVSNNATIPPYKFTYEHSLPFPSRLLGAGDYWGYNNGKQWYNIRDSIKDADYRYDLINPRLISSIKQPSYNYGIQGALSKIIYPTGGNTTFLFEPHEKAGRIVDEPIRTCDGNLGLTLSNLSFANNETVAKLTIHPQRDNANMISNVTCTMWSNYAQFPANKYFVEIRDSATNQLFYSFSYDPTAPATGCYSYTNAPTPKCTKQISFLPGTYYVKTRNDNYKYPSNDPDLAFASLDIGEVNCGFIPTPRTDSVIIGGFRLKQVIDEDPLTGRKQTRKYAYNNADVAFRYGDFLLENLHSYDAGMTDVPVRILSSSGVYSMDDVNRNYVGYANVRETAVDLNTGATTGYTDYQYTTNVDDLTTGPSYTSPPYPPIRSFDWLRGKLELKKVYKLDNSTPTLVMEERHFFSNLKSKAKIEGEAFYQYRYAHGVGPLNPDSALLLFQGDIKHVRFTYDEANVTEDKVILKEYTADGSAVVKEMRMTYDDDTYLETETQSFDSDGTRLRTVTKYPGNYKGITATDNISEGVKTLQNKFMLAKPVEQVVFQLLPGQQERVMTASFNSYYPGTGYPFEKYKTENEGPLSVFDINAVVNGKVNYDTAYKKQVIYDSYDIKGRINQTHLANMESHSYIWGYNNEYPIADITNASIDEVAYTSFEDDGTGNWSFIGAPVTDVSAPTGSKCFQLTGSNGISKTGLVASQKYIISYWTKNAQPLPVTGTVAGYPIKGRTVGGWTYYEHLVTSVNTVQITGQGLIDELREYPENAYMSTFTFYPNIGMQASVDSRSMISYYEYDQLGRLKVVRDMEGNIIRIVNYKYQQSTSN